MPPYEHEDFACTEVVLWSQKLILYADRYCSQIFAKVDDALITAERTRLRDEKICLLRKLFTLLSRRQKGTFLWGAKTVQTTETALLPKFYRFRRMKAAELSDDKLLMVSKYDEHAESWMPELMRARVLLLREGIQKVSLDPVYKKVQELTSVGEKKTGEKKSGAQKRRRAKAQIAREHGDQEPEDLPEFRDEPDLMERRLQRPERQDEDD